MSRRDNLSSEERNYKLWPTVDEDALSGEDLKDYLNNKAAVEAYIDGASPNDIEKKCNIRRQRISLLLERCLTPHEDGRFWGYRALKPRTRVKAYKREKKTTPGGGYSSRGGYAGAFNQFLETYPDIEELVTKLYLGKPTKKGENAEVGMKIKDIHTQMLAAARAKGLTDHDYPLYAGEQGTGSQGRRSLEKFLKGLFDVDFKGTTKARYGSEAARRAGSGKLSGARLATRPYEQVEIDAHWIDGKFTFTVDDGVYGEKTITVVRPWLLTLIDRFSQAVIAYLFVMKTSVSQEDVLRLLKLAIQPWELPDLEGTKLTYNDGAGMPSESIPCCAWALWDETHLDNALYFTADRVQTALTRLLGGAAIYGRYHCPNDRPYVENFFKILSGQVHRTASSTDSHPKGLHHNRPEAAAIDYHLDGDYLRKLLASIIANYNGKKQAGLGGRSPLEVLVLATRKSPPRLLLDPNRLRLLNDHITRTVRGNRAKGERPYVQYENVHYSGDVLGNMPSMIGKEITLEIDLDHMDLISAFQSSGVFFDYLKPTGRRWRFDHSYEQRKLLHSKSPKRQETDSLHEEITGIKHRKEATTKQFSPNTTSVKQRGRGRQYRGKNPLRR